MGSPFLIMTVDGGSTIRPQTLPCDAEDVDSRVLLMDEHSGAQETPTFIPALQGNQQCRLLAGQAPLGRHGVTVWSRGNSIPRCQGRASGFASQGHGTSNREHVRGMEGGNWTQGYPIRSSQQLHPVYFSVPRKALLGSVLQLLAG